MKFPDPDMPTMERLMGCAQLDPARASEVSSEIFSAVITFLIGSVGPQKTADIMRDWAGAVQRRALARVPQ